MTDRSAALRVATWNIRAAIGSGKPFPDRWWRFIDADRLRAIGEFLGGLDVDIAALQEVALVSRDGELLDNAGDLGRQLGMEFRYGATRTFDVTDGSGAVNGSGCFGNAILSRWPIRSSLAMQLPMAADDAYVEPPGTDRKAAGVRYGDARQMHEPRTLLIVRLEGLTVASTHFSHLGSGERAMQADATIAALADAGPVLLLGDLNAPIDAEELSPLADWVDGFDAAGVPAGDPQRITTDDGYRIDHVLARDAAISACRVLREAGDLSDHYPVVAEVAVG